MALLAKIIFSSLFVFVIGCKESSLSTVSDANTGGESAENKGACVVYGKETKEVQACFPDKTQETCNESFKLIYEDVAAGKYEKELVLKMDCTDGKAKVAERLAKTSTANSDTTENGKCVCGAYVQKESNQRYCLVARKNEKAKWQAVAHLPLAADCKVHCDGSDGLATAALASPFCKE